MIGWGDFIQEGTIGDLLEDLSEALREQAQHLEDCSRTAGDIDVRLKEAEDSRRMTSISERVRSASRDLKEIGY